MLYAEVCVNTPLGAPRPLGPGSGLRSPAGDDAAGQSFTYQTPGSLAGRLLPGHLVWIPFRGRRLQGVVLRLSDAAPDFQTREIISLVWAQPVLNAAQLALAHWISQQTLAPLIESLRLMLPAGLSQRGRTVFVRTAAVAPSGLSEKQQALLARIGQAPGDWSDITDDVKRVTQRDDLDPLIALGPVTREAEFPSPPPRPQDGPPGAAARRRRDRGPRPADAGEIILAGGRAGVAGRAGTGRRSTARPAGANAV